MVQIQGTQHFEQTITVPFAKIRNHGRNGHARIQGRIAKPSGSGLTPFGEVISCLSNYNYKKVKIQIFTERNGPTTKLWMYEIPTLVRTSSSRNT